MSKTPHKVIIFISVCKATILLDKLTMANIWGHVISLSHKLCLAYKCTNNYQINWKNNYLAQQKHNKNLDDHDEKWFYRWNKSEGR